MVLATTDPWPDLANCLEVLLPQVRALGGELIVGDGHGQALEDHPVDTTCLVWVRNPGASVFELRAEAVRLARGDIIATTEDHCIVAPDWCAQIFEAFRLHPKAMAVSGPVLNGSRDRLIDWANYLHSFGSSLPPYDEHRWYRTPPSANLAYRRSVFPSGPIRPGWMELELNPQLFQQGLFGMHAGMVVTHIQSHGFWTTFRMHYDNGRCTTGLKPIRFSRDRLPWNLFRGTLRGFGGGPEYRAIIRKSLPLVFLLSCCHALGEIVGSIAGPGRSPARLR